MLSIFEKRLCNILQEGLPVCHRPFEKIAKKLQTDKQQILRQTRVLQKLKIITNLRAIVNYNALGFTSTLATAHIEQNKLNYVVCAVNSLDGVSHNYARGHYYNLWFTLRAKSQWEIKKILKDLSGRFGTEFYSMPVKRSFKLDVCFDAQSGGERLLKSNEKRATAKRARLNPIEKKILERLEEPIKITEKPFDFLCSKQLQIDDVLKIIQGLIDKGVIRRIAAAVDYKRLGFRMNLLFACRVESRQIVKVGKELAKLPIVSHCYQRKPFAGFDYNLFAMCHGSSKELIQSRIKKFLKKFSIDDYVFLETLRQLKNR